MGRMFKYLGMGGRVGLGRIASSGWEEWGCTLEAGISPAFRLVETAAES